MKKMNISEDIIRIYIKEVEQKLDKLTRQNDYNEYAVFYYEGKIDALKSLLKGGNKMDELDEGFGI